MTAPELAILLGQLRDADPAEFARLSGGLIAKQPVPDERPQTERVEIWPHGELKPLLVWPVDVKGWLGIGASRDAHTATLVAEEKRKAEATRQDSPADDLEALRSKWKDANPGERPPPRAGVKWFESQGVELDG